MNVSLLQSKAIFLGNRGLLKVKKYSPEILIGTGIVAGIAGAVLACKATLKADEILEGHKDKIDRINQARDVPDDEYTEEMEKHDKVVAYTQTAVEFAKLYAIPVGLGITSVACILVGSGIMKKRYLAVVGAYNLLSEGFASYRQRVIDEYGEDKDREYRYGRAMDDKDAEGKEGIPEVVGESENNHVIPYKSIYARYFDSTNPQWKNNLDMNIFFLKSQETYFNQMLKIRGHVFLNEVYDGLELPRSSAGAIVGWTYKTENGGDGFIDFNLYNLENRSGNTPTANSILLDFNVEGIVYDKI